MTNIDYKFHFVMLFFTVFTTNVATAKTLEGFAETIDPTTHLKSPALDASVGAEKTIKICLCGPTQKGPGHVRPCLKGNGADLTGRAWGDLNEGVGKFIFCEFEDLRLHDNPAWNSWLKKLKDRTQAKYLAMPPDSGEGMIQCTFAPGSLKSFNAEYTNEWTGADLARYKDLLPLNENSTHPDLDIKQIQTIETVKTLVKSADMTFPDKSSKQVIVRVWFQDRH